MKWRAELVDYVKANLLFATNHPRAFALECVKRGFYSQTTFLGDIERSVKRLTDAITSNKPLKIKYEDDWQI